jgi:hypothetical protein
MDEETRQEIEGMIGQMKCPKDFGCSKNGFERLCKARDFGLDKYLECLEDDPLQCKFAFAFGYGHLCQCPLRVFMAKKLRK